MMRLNRWRRGGWLLAVALGLNACAGSRQAAQPPAEAIRAGWTAYRLSEFSQALRAFAAAAANAPAKSEDWQQATYGLATTWNLRLPAADQDKERAAALYQQVIDADPQGDLAAWSLLALARMKHLVPVGEEPDYEQVRAAYQIVIDRFPTHLAGREAFIYLTATRVATLEPAQLSQAVEALQRFVSQTNDRTFFNPAYSLLAVAYQYLGRPRERMESEIKSLDVLELDPGNPFTELAWAYWNIATIAEFELGDFDTARVYYRRLLEEYPTDVKKYAVKRALARMDDLEARLRAEVAAP